MLWVFEINWAPKEVSDVFTHCMPPDSAPYFIVWKANSWYYRSMVCGYRHLFIQSSIHSKQVVIIWHNFICHKKHLFQDNIIQYLPHISRLSTINFKNPCFKMGIEENIIKKDENNNFVVATICLCSLNHTPPAPTIFILLGPSEFVIFSLSYMH